MTGRLAALTDVAPDALIDVPFFDALNADPLPQATAVSWSRTVTRRCRGSSVSPFARSALIIVSEYLPLRAAPSILGNS